MSNPSNAIEILAISMTGAKAQFSIANVAKQQSIREPLNFVHGSTVL